MSLMKRCTYGGRKEDCDGGDACASTDDCSGDLVCYHGYCFEDYDYPG
ncbi:11604_t:CDS:2 [Ambispora gerdemannii]|uniref:11604_t:CDS:1 n=1 Tax=Ambispora gerdemannii TaxID=144530 RepID=A0A9N8ZPX5_9GLOM|nr:11604_t:CDS:2 [Ambispora gerdemannii]